VTSGLTEFRETLADFRQLGSIALKLAIAAPLADIGLKLGPPPKNTVAILTSLTELVAIVWVFYFWHDIHARKLNVRMKVALAVFCFCMVGSLVLFDRFTVLPGQGRERVIEGLVLRSDVKPILGPSYTPEDALRDSEYDPDKVWTKWSVSMLRATVTVVWLLTFAGFAVYLTTFILLQRRRFAAEGLARSGVDREESAEPRQQDSQS
jgi:hypothetical protein